MRHRRCTAGGLPGRTSLAQRDTPASYLCLMGMGNALPAIIFGGTEEERGAETYREIAMDDQRIAAQIKRLTDLAHANGLLVSIAPFDDRGAALVIDDPLDPSGATVRMPASMALALLELIEGEPVPSGQESDDPRQFERDCLMDLHRIIEATR
jgi:hypothetical protein